MQAYIAYLVVDDDKLNDLDVAEMIAALPRVSAHADVVVWATDAEDHEVAKVLLKHGLWLSENA